MLLYIETFKQIEYIKVQLNISIFRNIPFYQILSEFEMDFYEIYKMWSNYLEYKMSIRNIQEKTFETYKNFNYSLKTDRNTNIYRIRIDLQTSLFQTALPIIPGLSVKKFTRNFIFNKHAELPIYVPFQTQNKSDASKRFILNENRFSISIKASDLLKPGIYPC